MMERRVDHKSTILVMEIVSKIMEEDFDRGPFWTLDSVAVGLTAGNVCSQS